MRTCPSLVAIIAVAGVACAAQATARDGAAAAAVGVVADPCHLVAPTSAAPAADTMARSAAPVELLVRDWINLCRYHDDNQAVIASGCRVLGVFIGDSITEGWGSASPELFNGGIVNRGIGGQTSSQILLRFMADVVALKPRFVHILAGTNDVAGNSGPLRIEDYQNNMMAMGDIARAHGIRVIIAALPPADRFDWRPGIDPRQPIAELNVWLRAYAARHHFYFVDYHAALADPGDGLPAELGNDGVHPNAKAYRLMRAVAELAIKQALAE